MEQEFKIGQTVRVTTTYFGVAVYDRKGNITNTNSPGVKFVSEGVVTYVGPEGKGSSAPIVRCKACERPLLSEFSFYPHEINNSKNMGGKLLRVEVLDKATR